MKWRELAFWPQSHLPQVGLGVAACLVMLSVNALVTPSVEPIYPAELDISSEIAGSETDGRVQPQDFITRPVFQWSRRPTVAVVVEQAMPEPVPEPPAETLDGAALLGVFASGGVGGAILKLEDGTRLRLYTGESVNGWELTETALRSAVFVASSGATSRLELAVASTLPDLETVPPVLQSKSPDAPPATEVAQTREAHSEPDTGRVSFGSIARDKALAVEARQRQKESEEESTDGY